MSSCQRDELHSREKERKGIGAGKFLSRIPFINRARETGYRLGGK